MPSGLGGQLLRFVLMYCFLLLILAHVLYDTLLLLYFYFRFNYYGSIGDLKIKIFNINNTKYIREVEKEHIMGLAEIMIT